MFLGERLHETTLAKLTRVLAQLGTDSIMDHESFELFHPREAQGLSDDKSLLPFETIDQIRVVAESDVSAEMQNVGLETVAA
jgi:hypothetical protein